LLIPQIGPSAVPQWHSPSLGLHTFPGAMQGVMAQDASGPQLLSIGEQDSPGAEHSTPTGPPHLQIPP
jgi:hypothetical protein